MDLVAEVGKRRLILRSRGADSATKGAKQAAWREVIAAVNASLNSSKERSKAEVKKQWQNLLERAKKERQLLLDTHGGEMNGADLPLSLISQRVLDVISESVMDEASTPDVDGWVDPTALSNVFFILVVSLVVHPFCMQMEFTNPGKSGLASEP